MLSFLALVLAIIALVIAQRARNEAAALRKLIAREPSPRAEGGAVPAASPPPPPSPPPAAPHAAAPIPTPVVPPRPAAAKATRPWNIDWENLVGIKLFSWIAGIALVLAAVFLFKYSVEHGWLRPSVRATLGLVTGIALLVVCELRIARNYRFTANAMHGAGIAILYATLFALHEQWHLWPATAVFAGMVLVTAAAVYLSTRRDSVFIALLGLLGGFATPALLSSGENRPIALFSYLLLLNGGISWIAWRKRWPLLTALSVALTAFYQWSWVDRFLSAAQLPLAAMIFVVFAAVAAISLLSNEVPFRRIAAAGAVLPLLFAFFTAIVPEYGARVHVLFGFLLLVTGGLAAIAMWRGPAWLHTLGGGATLLTFFVWLIVSYNAAAWPWPLAWLAAFIVLYLLRPASAAFYASPLLLFVFIGLAWREPQRFLTLSGAMLAMLAVVVIVPMRSAKPYPAALALALASCAVMAMQKAPMTLVVPMHAVIFAALLAVAWLSKYRAFAYAATALYFAALVAAEGHDDAGHLLLAAIVWALFVVYGFVARETIAVSIASLFAFATTQLLAKDLGYEEWRGLIPAAQALVLLLLRARDTAVLFAAIAIVVQFEKQWVTIGWALFALGLAWLYRRLGQWQFAAWSGFLACASLLRLAMTPRVDGYIYTYLLCGAAALVSAWLALPLRKVAATVGTIELFMLVNVAIMDYYAHRASAPLAQDLTYTIAWALFAIALLVTGIALGDRATRIAALALLLVTILKCFLHDLARLGGLYRVGSLFGLAVSLVLVGLMLQKFVMMKRSATEPSP